MTPAEVETATRMYRPAVARWARSYVGEQAAEDVAQAALEALVRHAPHVEPRAAAAWLRTTVWRLARDHRPRAAEVLTEAVPDGVANDTPEDTVRSAQLGAAVRRALATMPASRRSVVVEVLAEGRSVPEVAREEGIPESTVRARLRDGTEDLRGILTRERASEKRRSGGFSSWAVTMAFIDLLRRGREVSRQVVRTAIRPAAVTLGAMTLGGVLPTFLAAPMERPSLPVAPAEVAEVVLAPDPPPAYEVAPSAPAPVREASVNPERPAGPAPFTQGSRKTHDVGARMLRERLAHPQ